MTLSRRAFRQRRGQRDANHAAIVDGLRKLGHHVIDLAGAGDGVPDLCVYPRFVPPPWRLVGQTISIEKPLYQSREPTWLELKVAKGTMREAQLSWHVAATRAGVRVAVVRSLDEALAAVGAT